MAEKKIQENPLPEERQESAPVDKPKETIPEKPTSLPIPMPVPEPTVARPLPSFTKNQPNDLYRRLLPAVLFVLTFVTVMTMLLIYMDTVALGAQQFRLNMSRDYELARIGQESPALVAFVRQLHLQPRPPAPARRAALLVAGGPSALPALTHLPFDKVHLQVIDVRMTDPVVRNMTTQFLATKNYTVAFASDQGIMYSLNETRPTQER